MHAKSVQSCPTLCNPIDYITPQALLSMGFPRQEYESGLPFPPLRDLPNPGIKPKSPSLIGGFFTTGSPGTPFFFFNISTLIHLRLSNGAVNMLKTLHHMLSAQSIRA